VTGPLNRCGWLCKMDHTLLPPHPGPLPEGEDERSSGSRKIRARRWSRGRGTTRTFGSCFLPMNRTRNSLEMSESIGNGSWPQLTSKFWRCSLPMNLSLKSGSKLHALQTFRAGMRPVHLAKRLECVRLAGALGSRVQSAIEFGEVSPTEADGQLGGRRSSDFLFVPFCDKFLSHARK